MTNYNDGKWHGWNGGECPVHPESVVEYVFKDLSGVPRIGVNSAKHLVRTSGYCAPIIAFRVVKEHQEPREFWLVDGRAYDCKQAYGKNIHVREVIE